MDETSLITMILKWLNSFEHQNFAHRAIGTRAETTVTYRIHSDAAAAVVFLSSNLPHWNRSHLLFLVMSSATISVKKVNF